MNKLLNKGKVFVTYLTVFAILAVSMLSVFTGVTFTAGAAAGLESGITSEYTDPNNGTTFTEGDGTEGNPFIVETADQFAAVARGYVVTEGKYFKVKDGVKAFYMNGGETVANLTSARAVKTYFDATPGSMWWLPTSSSVSEYFKGNFDGNGVTIYGLYTGSAATGNAQASAALFPKVDGSVTIKNINLKNSYIEGSTFAAGIIASSGSTAGLITLENCSVEDCYIRSNRNAADHRSFGGVLLANTTQTLHAYNCIVVDNIATYAYDETELMPVISASANSSTVGGNKVKSDVSNLIVIGSSVCGHGWSLFCISDGQFKNVYTDSDLADLKAKHAGNTVATLAANNIKSVNKEALQGAAAVTTAATLDWENIWFANTTTYPSFRNVHTFGFKNNNDGTHSEICACGLIGLPAVHITDAVGDCTICDFENPCKAGHETDNVPEVPATETSTGTKAHKLCSVCGTRFIGDKAVTADDLIIPMIVTEDYWIINTYDDQFIVDNEGDGTEGNPYIIRTAAQLASVAAARVKDANNVTIDTTGVYFKVADGLKSFYMASDDATYGSPDQWDTIEKVKAALSNKAGVYKWWQDSLFKGHFDGNGATVYGLFADKENAGLFHLLGKDATIKNIAVKNSYFKASSGYAGAIAAQVQWRADIGTGTATIENCVSQNNYIEATSNAGAIIGTGREDALIISNCLVAGNEFAGEAVMVGNSYCVSNKISNSVVLGAAPFVKGVNNLRKEDVFSNVYTDADLSVVAEFANYTSAQILHLTADAMKGVAGRDAMNLDWDDVWFANTSTPELRIFHKLAALDLGDGTHTAETCDCGVTGLTAGKHVLDLALDCVICNYKNPCEHNYKHYELDPETVEKEGTKAHDKCSKCGVILLDGVAVDEAALVIPKIDPCERYGHDLSAVNGTPATYETVGIKAHDVCSYCGKFFIENVEFTAEELCIPITANSDTWDGQRDIEISLLDPSSVNSVDNPYIIDTAEKFVAMVSDNRIDTTGKFYKVADGIEAFFMNGYLPATLDSADAIKAHFEANPGHTYWVGATFKGHFDGNGVTIYGLYATKESAGLFPIIGKDAVIENVSLKNSYIKGNETAIVGGLFGQVQWYNGISNEDVVTFNNTEVVNCYIESNHHTVKVNDDHTETHTYVDAGVVGGHIREAKLVLNNFFAYKNSISSASGNLPGAIGEGWASADEIKNSIFLGVTPYSLGADKARARAANYSRVYTDMDLAAGAELALIDGYSASQITKLSEKAMKGEAGAKAMSLDWDSVWFANKGLPMLRAFHEFNGTSLETDGHTEKTDCCGVAGVLTTNHIYVNGTCSSCGFDYPCVGGHNFVDVPAKDATTSAPGNIAHKHCTQCQKNYAQDAATDATVESALSDDDVIIPQIIPSDDWDGTWDDTFWLNNDGDGTATNPYIIETAEQLASVLTARLRDTDGKIVSTSGMFFKVKTGVTAFYMNGGKAVAELKSAEQVKSYFEKNEPNSSWWTGGVFEGNFNGNGATVYGLYATKENAGLFPVVGQNTVIKNITVANSYMKGTEDGFVGGIFAQVQWFAGISNASSITVRNSAVVNCYIESNFYKVTTLEDGTEEHTFIDAGVVGGHIRELKLKLRNFLSYGNKVVNNPTGNIGCAIGEGWGGTDEIVDCVFIGTAPFSVGADKSRAKGESFKNVYTDQDLTEGEALAALYAGKEEFSYDASQITKLETKQMTGSAAKKNMKALNWETGWLVNADSYPTPRLLSLKDYAPGYAWSGEIAAEFPSGEGTKNSPYKVNTAEYLALMLTNGQKDAYYELTADIMINDASADDWKSTAKAWFTSKDVAAFNGTLNGAGYRVTGIYNTGVASGESAGLIPVIESGTVYNLTVDDSYISGYKGSSVGAIIGSVLEGAEKPIYIQGNTVGSGVTLAGKATAGGVLGNVGYAVVRISNCISKAKVSGTVAGGIVGASAGAVDVKKTISVGKYPFGSAEGFAATDVYTNTVDANVGIKGVKVLDTKDMKGDKAVENMNLDFGNIWTPITGDYPTLNGAIVLGMGAPGEVWTGAVAGSGDYDDALYFAGGEGTVDNPYLIETAEQLARCATMNKTGAHYKLIADIYLNDVNSPLWEDKVGCNEWFNSKTGSTWAAFTDGSFDGDGHVVYGLYYNRAHYEDNSAFNGLFATLGGNSEIKNVGLSQAYMAGSTYNGENFNEFMGLVGYINDWDDIELEAHDAHASKAATSSPEYQEQMPLISNCFVDHTCYLSGTCVGGIIGAAHGSFKVENCIFTGTLKGKDKGTTAGLVGQDMGYGGYWYDCVSFPQTCDRPLGGSSNADWRKDPGYWPTTAEDVYYFSMYRVFNTVTKISKPEQRIGTEAMNAMTGLDWEGKAEDGENDIWRTVKGGTPVLTVFAKHRSAKELEAFSDKSFQAPEVQVNFVTGVTGMSVEPIKGRMYSKMTLPELTREGYIFTGWYVFDDYSVEYPYDYFPPRNLNLFAGWEAIGVIQNFESYPNTIWDFDDTRWTYNRPGAVGGYKNAYVRTGSKSMHLLNTSSDETDCLLNYKDMLVIGQKYTMTMWVTTDSAKNPKTTLSLVQNTYPDYLATNVSVDEIAVVKGLTVGEWTQYTYTFKAETPWVSLRATGDSSLYFDDIVIAPVGKTVKNNNAKYLKDLTATYINGIVSSSQAKATNASATAGVMIGGNIAEAANVTAVSESDGNNALAVIVAVIIACAVIAVISRKNLVEVIENK